MAVVSEQKSLVFILDVPFELNQYIERTETVKIFFLITGR